MKFEYHVVMIPAMEELLREYDQARKLDISLHEYRNINEIHGCSLCDAGSIARKISGWRLSSCELCVHYQITHRWCPGGIAYYSGIKQEERIEELKTWLKMFQDDLKEGGTDVSGTE